MKPVTVLVVEDDLHTAKVLQKILTRDRMLRYLKLNVVTVCDGNEGLVAFREHAPALVITDLLMPRMDGFEFVKQLREGEGGRDVPILVTSAVFRESPDLRRLQSQHRVEFQPKPFSPHTFAERVHRLIRPPERSVRRSVPPPVSRPGAPPTTGPVAAGLAAVKTPPPGRSQPAASPAPQGAEAGSTATASTAGPAEPPVPRVAATRSGDLSLTPLAGLLFEALEGQWSGTVDIRRGKVQKVIYLLAGHPIFVQSNLRAETLGQLLVRRGGLTSDQDRTVLTKAQEHGIKYGEALVRLGLMGEGEVMAELVAQTRFKLENCLRWHEGGWSFTPDVEVGRKVPHCTVDPVEVVFFGLRRTFNVEEAIGRLGAAENTGGAIVVDSRFEIYRAAFVDIFGDAVLQQLAAGRSLADLTQQSAFANAVLQVDVLQQCGLIRFTEGGGQRWAEPADSLPLGHLTLPRVDRSLTDDGINIVVDSAAEQADRVTSAAGLAPGADASLDVEMVVQAPASARPGGASFSLDIDIDEPEEATSPAVGAAAPDVPITLDFEMGEVSDSSAASLATRELELEGGPTEDDRSVAAVPDLEELLPPISKLAPAGVDLGGGELQPPAPSASLDDRHERPTGEQLSSAFEDLPPPFEDLPPPFDDLPPPIDDRHERPTGEQLSPAVDDLADDLPPPVDDRHERPTGEQLAPAFDDLPPLVDDRHERPTGEQLLEAEAEERTELPPNGEQGEPERATRAVASEPVGTTPPPPEDPEMARQLIEAFYLRLHEADHYQVLGVIPDTDQFSVEVAYQIKRKQFDLERYRGMDLGKAYGYLEQIIDRLDEAFATLADPAQRAAYDQEQRAKRKEQHSPALLAEELFRQGETLLAQDRYAEAAEALSQAAEMDEQGEYVAREALARFMAAGKTTDAAIDAMVKVQQVLAANPEQTAAHLVAAAVTRLRGDDEESLRHLEAVLRIDPANRDAFDGLETVLLELHRAEELEVHFRRTIHLLGDRHPRWAADLWRRLVVLYRDQIGDPKKARLACQTALRLNPGDDGLKDLLGQLSGSD